MSVYHAIDPKYVPQHEWPLCGAQNGITGPDADATCQRCLVKLGVIPDPRRKVRPSDAAILAAVWQITYQTGRPVSFSIRGGHATEQRIVCGEHMFHADSNEDLARFVRWADAVQAREPNAPIPEP